MVGHNILIWDDTNDMKIGKIVELINSDDGEVRQVIVSTANSTGTYPVFKLRYLEVYLILLVLNLEKISTYD